MKDKINKENGNTTQNFSATGTIVEINKVLKNPKEDYKKHLNYYVSKLEQSRDSFCEQYKNKPEILLEKMIQFLNVMFRSFYVKKFYNSAPNVNLEEFTHLPLHEQFFNCVLDKQHTLLSRENIQGGDCVHWAIILKNFIDSRHISGLETKYIKSLNHRRIIMKYKKRFFRIDVIEGRGSGKEPIVQESKGWEKGTDQEYWENTNYDIIQDSLQVVDYLKIAFSINKSKKMEIKLKKNGFTLNEQSYEFTNMTEEKINYLETLPTKDIIKKLLWSTRKEVEFGDIFPYLEDLSKKIKKEELISLLRTGSRY